MTTTTNMTTATTAAAATAMPNAAPTDRAPAVALGRWLAIIAGLWEEGVTELVINRAGEVLLEKPGAGWIAKAVPALTWQACQELAKLTATWSGQKLDRAHPILSATWPSGERCQIVVPPAVGAQKFSLTCRRVTAREVSLEDYEKAGAFKTTLHDVATLGPADEELLALKAARRYREFLQAAVRHRKNIIVSGPTGSGKTTLMRSLIRLVPATERLLSIENVDELDLARSHPNSVALFYSAGGQGGTAVTQGLLLQSALRMKPDRIFVAELISGDDAFYFLRNVNSGHPGSITSLHASSARLAIEQLGLFIRESVGAGMTSDDVRRLVTLCVDIIVQMHVGPDGRRHISEVYYEPHNG